MNSNRVNKIQPGNEHLDKVVTPTSNTTWSPANNLLGAYSTSTECQHIWYCTYNKYDKICNNKKIYLMNIDSYIEYCTYMQEELNKMS